MREVLSLANIWIWDESISTNRGIRILRTLAQWLVVMSHGFFEDRLLVHASALTYSALLTLLPMIAVALGIIQWTGVVDTDTLRKLMGTHLPEFKVLTEQILDYLDGTNFHSLGLVGSFFLLTTVMSMMAKVERAFNEIWQVHHARPFWRKTLDYLLIILMISASLTLAFFLLITSNDLFNRWFPTLGSFIGSGLIYRVWTLVFLGIGFSLLMRFMPNTHVSWRAAFISGFSCGLLYLLVSSAYFGLQIGMANYNLVYSSLAALPITIIWIDISWIIILISAKLSFTITNRGTFRPQMMAAFLPPEFVEENALRIALTVASHSIQAGDEDPSANELSRELKLPLHLMTDFIDTLIDREIIEGHARRGVRMHPDKIEQLKLQDILKAVRRDRQRPVSKAKSLEAIIHDYQSRLHLVANDNPANLTVAEVLRTL